MSDIAIRVEGLSKQYRIGKRERCRTLRESLNDSVAAPFRSLRRLLCGSGSEQSSSDRIWALKDVSFEIPRGHSLSIRIWGPSSGGRRLIRPFQLDIARRDFRAHRLCTVIFLEPV